MPRPLQAAAASAGAWLRRAVPMPDDVHVETDGRPDRRRFLVRCLLGLHAGIASTLSFILGSAILSPSFRGQSPSWLRAASFDDVPDDEPLTVTLRLVRQDGVVQVVDRPAVYLIKSGSNGVRAMQATCTHLGCRTSYERKTKRILCPCHGGAYNTQGDVIAGPPPASLHTLPARVENGQVLVAI